MKAAFIEQYGAAILLSRQLFQAGAIRPPEIRLYRLSEAADAHRLSESRHFRGKLVFQVA